nr:sigma-54-dependent Fis family transcriptional regulator [Sphingomonas sp.]
MRDEEVRSLLLVDADASERRHMTAIAARAGWSVLGTACTESALGLLQGPQGREVRAAVLSAWDPAESPALIAALRRATPDLPVIVLGDGGSIALAVDAMRAGASDFLARPIAAERMFEALAPHADRRRAHGELAPMSEKMAPELSLEKLVGAAPDFRNALAV